ncbi:isoaspartyl peptidase/L-asparaginase [Aspergillus stella-maris]|uniref:isoaspartyl peptidase/L-asparaginase n=1 Tax=Aspergillus stella-maris TaxID=1810926 RepID=UPI003CCE0667
MTPSRRSPTSTSNSPHHALISNNLYQTTEAVPSIPPTTNSTTEYQIMSPPPKPTFKPTLILHGGAGQIARPSLPPSLWKKYHSSLLSYLRSTRTLLENGATALDAAVHAVSLMEDDELFNCGRGSVFTTAGRIEMEASVMVTSVLPDRDVTERAEALKRGAGVIGLRNVRHPIRLAREVLVRNGVDEDGDGDGGSMHSQLSGGYVEELGRGWGLEFMPDEWFWTRKRWEEHRRGLGFEEGKTGLEEELMFDSDGLGYGYPSQGTVGCVCLDQWGDLAVATSTGGLTNKLPGRVGDTPTLGAGFWAEAWEEAGRDSPEISDMQYLRQMQTMRDSYHDAEAKSLWDMTLADCFPGLPPFMRESSSSVPRQSFNIPNEKLKPRYTPKKRRAVAVSGTGNGDSFLRTAAARTTCAMMRFSERGLSLEKAVSAVAGADGELQRSAGRRWGKTGEGAGGIIGIEVEIDNDVADSGWALRHGKVVFDFNCGGMFRAWVDEGPDGGDVEHVMVFKEAYQ